MRGRKPRSEPAGNLRGTTLRVEYTRANGDYVARSVRLTGEQLRIVWVNPGSDARGDFLRAVRRRDCAAEPHKGDALDSADPTPGELREGNSVAPPVTWLVGGAKGNLEELMLDGEVSGWLRDWQFSIDASPPGRCAGSGEAGPRAAAALRYSRMGKANQRAEDYARFLAKAPRKEREAIELEQYLARGGSDVRHSFTRGERVRFRGMEWVVLDAGASFVRLQGWHPVYNGNDGRQPYPTREGEAYRPHRKEPETITIRLD